MEQRWEEDYTPVSAELISVIDRRGAEILDKSARGILGYLLFGTFGAAVGITRAKTKEPKKAVFRIEYASGRIGKEKVHIRSKRFEELIRLTEQQPV